MISDDQGARQKQALQALYGISENIYNQLDQGQIPHMSIPLRTKGNIRFDTRKSVWKYGRLTGVRSAKKMNGAKMLLRTLYVLDLIRDMVETGKSSTLREMYYISEGWEEGKFQDQNESNLLAEDLEIVTGALREDFKLRPEESGASIIGNITVEEINRRGQPKRFNCREDVGDAGYTIPYNVERGKLKLLEADADFVLAAETGGMFDRLVENRFDEDSRALLVHLKGQPARSTRRLIKRINDELKLPVVTFSMSGDERVLIWECGLLKPVTIGPYIDELMDKHGKFTFSLPFPHEKTPVEDLGLEAPCITADGSFIDKAKIASVIRHDAPEEMFEIRTAYGFGVRVTGSHSVMVFDNYSLVPRNVREVKLGDLVVASMGLPRGRELSELDCIELLRSRQWFSELRTNMVWYGKRMRLQDALVRGRNPETIYWPSSHIPLPRRMPLTTSLAKFLGYYAAEGSISHHRVTLSFGTHEEDVIQDALQAITQVFHGVKVSRNSPHPTEVQLTFGGRIIAEFMEAIGTGKGAKRKAVPWPLFSMSVDKQIAFLRALMKGDGHSRRREGGSSITIATVSRTLASDLLMLFAQLGLNASVRRRGIKPSKLVRSKEGQPFNLVYDVCLHGELSQLQRFRQLLEHYSNPGVQPRQLINSKYLAIPRELITQDMRRVIRRFNQGKGNGQFGDFYWGCKRITYPVLGRFLAEVPLGKSERLDFLGRLIDRRIALLPVRSVAKIPRTGPRVYDLEIPAAQTFLGGLGPVCLHNTDCDPWSFRIHASVAYGAIKTAHISEYLATPSAMFLGITPSDIENYNLPTDKLTDKDVKALQDIQSDPRFNDEFWRSEVEAMLRSGKKAEQQALAKYGLDYVTDTYLPEKLAELGLA